MVIQVIPVFLSVLQVLCGLCEVWCCPEAAVPDAATPGCRSLCVTSWDLRVTNWDLRVTSWDLRVSRGCQLEACGVVMCVHVLPVFVVFVHVLLFTSCVCFPFIVSTCLFVS